MTDYLEILNRFDLSNANRTGLRVLDLFAGCGGLALGFEAAGFETIGYEKDEDAVSTYNQNLHGQCIQEFLTVETEFPQADLIIGGPPCQPFSVGGLQMGLQDSRDGFPVFIKAVEKIQPIFWMFENVRGMMYRNKAYLHEIIKKMEGFGYQIDAKVIKAVNFQVPQNRERLFVIGHKGGYSYPTSCAEQFTAGDAVADIAYNLRNDDVFLTSNQDEYIARYEKASKCVNPRDLHMDRPARTITCRNLAGATADMQRIKLPDGRRKRLNVREAARIQSFPDWFELCGAKNSQFNQLGNAVPPLLSYHLANSIRAFLLEEKVLESRGEQMSML
tara:strand:- start:381 stop:1376 length:996 start_codon:yes stop_codon:yes gene_type:complete